MKRERRPPKTWRRNMLAGLGLMVVLDAIIISPGPDLAREALALIVTVVVGGFVLATWLSNSRMEREAALKGGDGEAKPGSRTSPTNQSPAPFDPGWASRPGVAMVS